MTDGIGELNPEGVDSGFIQPLNVNMEHYQVIYKLSFFVYIFLDVH